MGDLDDLIPTFLDITSTDDVQVARSYLEMSDGNLDTAVNLFFENGGTGAVTGNARDTGSSTQPSANSNVNTTESDEDLARKLQRQMYEDGTPSNGDNVRQPIQAVHEQLIPEYGYIPPRVPPERGMFGSARRGVFNQEEDDLDDGYREHNTTANSYDDDYDIDDDDREIDYGDEYEDSYEHQPFGTDSNTVVDLTREDHPYRAREDLTNQLSSTQKRLARLFRPPWDIISKLDFDSAKKLARDEKKWVLINIQDVTDFRCQCLNRDFWSSNQIKDLVREKFIFLQFQHDSPNGQLYRNLYPFKDYPHIAIIDPWTGERMKVWNTNPEVHKFIDDVADFIAKFSLNKNESNVNLAEHSRKQQEGTSGTEKAPITLDDDECEDNENRNTANSTSIGVDVKTSGIDKSESTAASNVPPTYTQIIANIPETDIPDPTCAQEGTTRIQIRSGLDGKRVVKRFALADPVKVVFQYVKFAFKDSLNGQAFTLKMQRQNLFDDLDKSISEAGLQNASILLDVVSDDEEEEN